MVYEAARVVVPAVLPITGEILPLARDLLDRHTGLMARDAVHASFVVIHDLDSICSFDRDFDRISDLRRIEPALIE